MPAFTSRLLIPLFCLESVGGDWPGQPCTSQADCKYAGCSDFEFHVCDVWDGDGDGIDEATYRCIRGTTTSACSGKPNGHGYEDSDGRGWCWDGRKDEWCPLSSQDTCSGSTFTFHAERKSWHAARDTCRERGGDLASIHSAAENDEAYALGRGQEVWLGLNGEEREDVWVWSDGSPMDYRHWAPGEPNNYDGDEDCGGYWSGRAMASPEKPKGWDSLGGKASCSAKYPFICRRCKAKPADEKTDEADEKTAEADETGSIVGIVVGTVVGLVALLATSTVVLLLCLKSRNVGRQVHAQVVTTSTAIPISGAVQMQGTVAQPVMATVVHESFATAAAYPSAFTRTPSGTPMGTYVAGSSASMPLAEMVEILKREVGVGGTIESVVKGAAQQLGVAHEGQPLMQTAQLCLQALGHSSN